MNSNEERIVPLAISECQIADSRLGRRAIRQRYGLRHPLNRFALNGTIKDEMHADVLVDSLDAIAMEPWGSLRWRSARWFLLESDVYFEYCEAAGVDARKWRRHLRRVFRVLDHHMGAIQRA